MKKPALLENAILTELKNACNGMVLISEIEAPWQTCSWKQTGTLTRKTVLELTEQPPDSKVQIPDLDSFFADFLVERKWHSEAEKALVRRYQNLVKVLKANLKELKVFKIGDSKMKVFVVGKGHDGSWMGLQTEALET